MLKGWRERRKCSQLDLALDAGVSQRHLSFLESGRAQPSREMILQLKRGYLNTGYFRTKFDADILELWQRVWEDYRQDDLCTIDQDTGRIDLTREGLLQVDSLLPAFFEPQFQNVRYT